jgi:hypothetical protein
MMRRDKRPGLNIAFCLLALWQVSPSATNKKRSSFFPSSHANHIRASLKIAPFEENPASSRIRASEVSKKMMLLASTIGWAEKRSFFG